MQTYNFSQQFEWGENQENVIFEHLKTDGWQVMKANRNYQKKGIDCFVTKNNQTYSIEIKSDKTASRTQNAFIETTSVDSANKKGWVYTSQSDFIFYFLPLDRIAYVFKTKWLKENIDKWKKDFPLKKIKNNGYFTEGIIIPLCFLEKNADSKNLIVLNL